MEALGRLDHTTAINGVVAYNDLKDKILSFLGPFASEGKTVTENDIAGFFEVYIN